MSSKFKEDWTKEEKSEDNRDTLMFLVCIVCGYIILGGLLKYDAQYNVLLGTFFFVFSGIMMHYRSMGRLHIKLNKVISSIDDVVGERNE